MFENFVNSSASVNQRVTHRDTHPTASYIYACTHIHTHVFIYIRIVHTHNVVRSGAESFDIHTMLNAPNTNAPAKQIHDDKTSRVRARARTHVRARSLTHSAYDARAERGSGDKAWHTLLDM